MKSCSELMNRGPSSRRPTPTSTEPPLLTRATLGHNNSINSKTTAEEEEEAIIMGTSVVLGVDPVGGDKATPAAVSSLDPNPGNKGGQ